MTKDFWKSKTLWFNVLAFVVAVTGAFGYTGELPGEAAVFVPAVIAVINFLLRFVTKQPIV